MKAMTLFLLATMALAVGCHKKPPVSGGGPGGRDKYDCYFDPNDSTQPYTAVSKKKDLSGRCVVKWKVDDPTIDQTGHPTIYVSAKNKDRLKFRHGKCAFTYSIHLEPATQTGCDATPFADANAGKKSKRHGPIDVVQNGSTQECTYKLQFTFPDHDCKDIDPHISVGK